MTLTHLDSAGTARMVDVSDKAATARMAVAEGFIAIAPVALDAIRANAAALGATSIAIIATSAIRLPRTQACHLILADPPYAAGSGSAVVASVTAADWLAPGGWLAIETERGATVDPGLLTIEVERDTGRARLTLLRLS